MPYLKSLSTSNIEELSRLLNITSRMHILPKGHKFFFKTISHKQSQEKLIYTLYSSFSRIYSFTKHKQASKDGRKHIGKYGKSVGAVYRKHPTSKKMAIAIIMKFVLNRAYFLSDRHHCIRFPATRTGSAKPKDPDAHIRPAEN